MEEHPQIQTYLKKIEKELVDIDRTQKKSIIQEIKEHLDDKIGEAKRGTKVSKISSKKVKRILEEFGEPEEIAREYRRQLSEEQEPTFGKKKSSTKRIILSIITIVIVASLIIAGFTFLGVFNEKKDNEKGPSGPWLQAVAWKPNGDYCLVVGEGMPIVKSDGVIVESIDSPIYINFYDVAWHPSGEYALVCGTQGSIYKYDGANLTDLSLQVTDTLWAIKFSPDGEYALAVGMNGIIGMVKSDQSSCYYIPDSVVVDIDLNDLAWNSDGSLALLVGYYSSVFTKGVMLSFSPGNDNILNGTYSLLTTPGSLSTCFSTLWIEEWHSFIVTANMGQLYRINENWTINSIPNHLRNDPILDAMWHPTESRVLLVGGLAGWNAAKGIYELDKSTRIVMCTDGQSLNLIVRDQGPHFLSCEWNPKEESAILIGAFGVTYKYQDGEVTEISIDIQ